jgi:hypothetical protein
MGEFYDRHKPQDSRRTRRVAVVELNFLGSLVSVDQRKLAVYLFL